MSDILAKAIASLRYLFVVAVVVLAALAVASLAKGVLEAFDLVSTQGAGLFQDPISGPVPHFIRAAFLYFLAVALCFLFVGDVPAPQWMVVRNLFHLRTKVLIFVTIILPLFFMGRMAHSQMDPRDVLFLGGGVFLVMAVVYLFLRHGSPSGDEAISREGNRPPPQARTGEDERGRGDARPRSRHGGPPGKPSPEEKGERQREDMRFQKDSLPGQGPGGGKEASNVTVKPAPRRPFRRRGR